MILESKVVDLTEVGAGSDDIGTMLEQIGAERLDQRVDGGIRRSRCNLRIK